MENTTNPIRPNYYDYDDMEAIDIMEMTSTDEEFEGYLRNNIIKYILRYKDKNGIEDLEKAKWHLDRLIGIYTFKDVKDKDIEDIPIPDVNISTPKLSRSKIKDLINGLR